jgi:NTP pyrophosphatase (non-canonical NTP hydrolase)
MEQQQKLHEIIAGHSLEEQLEQTIEEASEFILAAQKLKRFPQDQKRFDDLLEETADMLIMAEQMCCYLGEEYMGKMIDNKLDRELKRMQGKKRVPKNGEY